jgi:hypothetical protein
MKREVTQHIRGALYLPVRLWRGIWSLVWTVAEQYEISLWKFAPWVFYQSLGANKMTKVK